MTFPYAKLRFVGMSKGWHRVGRNDEMKNVILCIKVHDISFVCLEGLFVKNAKESRMHSKFHNKNLPD